MIFLFYLQPPFNFLVLSVIVDKEVTLFLLFTHNNNKQLFPADGKYPPLLTKTEVNNNRFGISETINRKMIHF